MAAFNLLEYDNGYLTQPLLFYSATLSCPDFDVTSRYCPRVSGFQIRGRSMGGSFCPDFDPRSDLEIQKFVRTFDRTSWGINMGPSETPQCVNSTVSRTLLSWTLGLGILDLILIILTHSARVVLTASHRLLSSNSRLTWQVECWHITIQKKTCDLFFPISFRRRKSTK